MPEKKTTTDHVADLRTRAEARAKTSTIASRKTRARVVGRNRSSHKQTAAARALFKTAMGTIFDGIRDGILCADVKSKRFVVANKAICRMLGYTGDELLKLGVQDVHAAKDLPQVLAIFDQLVENESMPIGEVRMRRKDGSFFSAEITGARNELLGHVCAIGVIRDITARKQAEAEKANLENMNRQLQKAESLGRMAGAIAHHFNNKLMAVMGNLELAIDDVPQGTPLAELLNHAMQASSKAADVSQQMLTYLGIEHGKRELLDLAEACRQHLPILRAARPSKVQMQDDLPCPGPVINVNAHQLQQVLTNLVVNAWDAIGDRHGSLHLTVSTVAAADVPAAYRRPIGWQPCDPAYACLSVTDTGGGISDKNAEQLFDPFFSTKFTGRGLGLPFVLGIMRSHNGAVTVESELGRGSTFRIFLPVSAEEIPCAPANTATVREIATGGTVLLVDDEESVRQVASAMLVSCGFAVLAASDGSHAIAQFHQHQDDICCVLCNLTMPDMDGWQTIAALRQLAPDIPVVLTSGYDEDSVMVGDHPAWPQAFLSKPYHAKSLHAALSQAMLGKHAKAKNKH